MQKFIDTMLRAAIVTGLLYVSPATAQDDLDATFRKDVLVIVSSAYACYRFDIYLAGDGPQRQRGLMFVRYLPRTTGMLFVYDTPQYLSMWMKNTYIPLDMVFAREDGTVSLVVENTEPLSLRTISATEPGNFVLELNAGTAAEFHIDASSRLIWIPADSD